MSGHVTVRLVSQDDVPASPRVLRTSGSTPIGVAPRYLVR